MGRDVGLGGRSSLMHFKYHFTLKWPLLLFTLIAGLLFAWLGVWQLERAAEKKQLLRTAAKEAKQIAVIWRADSENPKPYQSIVVECDALPQFVLLDNQHYQHQFGYQVLTPCKLSEGQWVFIDRGFIAGDVSRQSWPQLTLPSGRVRLQGQVYYPTKTPWTLGPAFERHGQVVLIEQLDTQLLGQILHKSVYPFIIRLDKNEANGYVRAWPIVSMSPERHQAYALQWFLLALVALIIIVWNLKKSDENFKN